MYVLIIFAPFTFEVINILMSTMFATISAFFWCKMSILNDSFIYPFLAYQFIINFLIHALEFTM